MSATQHPIVNRHEGETPSERYLAHLCDRTFLSLWSYPGLFRNQGNSKGGDGKEVCDLIVFFGDHVILFSDKSCKFPDSGDLGANWRRWFKKAVLKSAEQIWGAERWITDYPERLFVDKGCKQRFPLKLPAPGRIRFHRIVVAHNVSQPCRDHFGGGSGTLFFDSDIQGSMHWDRRCGPCEPFQVGWVDKNRGFVHVLDDIGLELVLKNRDTISDFLYYLQAKEELLRRPERFFIAGEEELLAKYLTTFRNNEHAFDVPAEFDLVMIPEGLWEDFRRSDQRKAQVAADQISYSWDALIETFNRHILGGTSQFASPVDIGERERIMRFLAREPRLRRRILSDALNGLIEKSKPNQRATRVVLPSSPGDPHFVFLLLPKLGSVSEDLYRSARLRMLEALCMVTKLEFPGAEDILGIATETGASRATRSEDALSLDARTWSTAMQVEAKRLQVELGLLVNVKRSGGKFYEFPVPLKPRTARATPGKNPRNKPCPCRSGRKYKKCCGRSGQTRIAKGEAEGG